MKIYFLGTNGWCDTDLGNTLCVLVETSQAYIVFDAGNGLFKLDKYVKDRRPIYLFLSHFHLDHIIGLHGLNKFSFPQGINIFGPKGIKEMFKLVINTPYSKPIHQLKIKVKVGEINKDSKFPFDIRFKKLIHTTECYGYRLSADDKTIAFCTDTGPCKEIEVLANNADLLIAESSLPPGKIDANWPHLNPQQAALAAKNAGAKRLVLVHFDAGVYLTNKDRILAQNAARKIFKNTLAAEDGLVEVV
ncbi:MAG: ribonuclease Z [Candidatus Omnitrophota bacterium]|jgi:ribonuclease BN (tRNA processing enzyme)